MTATVPEPGVDASEDRRDSAVRLLRSSEELSYDPSVVIDWDAPVEHGYYGLSPEWCSLYGTAYWDELTEEQRKRLSMHESASIASTGIWFEMILQQLILRDFYAKDPSDPAFQWALTEVADECRHSIMFARGAAKLESPTYVPKPFVVALGKFCAMTYSGEAAYASMLVAEEVLDVMQRDWMRDERVTPLIRTINNIHVVEESRHMRFAREETRERLRGVGRARRNVQALFIALSAYTIVGTLVNDEVYENAGLDPKRALREARANEHYKAKMRASCTGLMEFLDSCGLLTRPAMQLYRRANLV